MDFTKICRDLNELDKDTKLAVEYLLQACEAKKIPIKIHETYRSQERQDYLYCQGRSVNECISAGISSDFAKKYARAGQQVTWTRDSNHKKRRAVDFIHKTLAYNVDNTFWKSVADIAKEIGFEAGYYWKGGQQDRPHIQLPPGVKPKPVEEVYMIEKKTVIVDGKEVKIDQILTDGKTFTGARELLESLGLGIKVEWDNVKKVMTIKTK